MQMKWMPVVRVVCSGIAAAGILLGIVGCGGSSKSPGLSPAASSTGRATLTVRWPERSRLIPFAAESIRVRLTSESKLLGEALLTRPTDGGTATASFDRLPIGQLTAEGIAYPNTNGTGVVQAQAQTTATINNGQVAQIRLTLASTISQVVVTPSTANISVNGTISLTASAKNTAGETVFILPATMEWRSLNTSIATVEVGGTVRGIAEGIATIEARETESGKTGTAVITVGSVPVGEVKCDATTGHCYEVVRTPNQNRWTEVKPAAEQRFYQGRQGHLATVTSASEMAFLLANFTDVSNYYLGGYQDTTAPDYSEPGGGWRWVTGEPWGYTKWWNGEPNDADHGNENYVQISNVTGQHWNDIADFHPIDAGRGYIVEYEPAVSGAAAYDGFAYNSGEQILNKNGGVNWSDAWSEGWQLSYSPAFVHDTGLTFGNLKVTGKAVRTTSTDPFGIGRHPVLPLGTTGSVVFYSGLIRPLQMQGGHPDTYFGFGIGALFFGRPGGTTTWGIEPWGAAGNPALGFVGTGITSQVNRTDFLVVKITFADGPDRIEMWANPTPGQPLPTPQAVKTDHDVGIPDGISTSGSVPTVYDELRIGPTWESVSPVGP